MTTPRPRALSGMRPTGALHLGHLAGALRNWVALQETHDCFFMVADWHALMSEYEHPERLAGSAISNVTDWLACGIDPKRSVIFRQSDVPEHLELYAVLSMITPLGWVERVPTYKEQLRELGRHLFFGVDIPVFENTGDFAFGACGLLLFLDHHFDFSYRVEGIAKIGAIDIDMHIVEEKALPRGFKCAEGEKSCLL